MDPGEQLVEVLPGVFRTRPLAKTVFPLKGIPVVPTKINNNNNIIKGHESVTDCPKKGAFPDEGTHIFGNVF